MTVRLKGKVALITGSSRGIGRAAAIGFAREGASFIGVHYGSDSDAALSAVRDIEALGSKAVAIHADLRQGKQAAESIWEKFGAAVTAATGEARLDILVNNAGIAPAIALEDTDEEAFDDLMAINFKAPFFLIQAAADHIRDNGRIINVSTGFNRIAAPTHPLYAASKGALETLTLALAPVFGPRGITVNTVMPGVTATDMNLGWLANPEARAAIEANAALGRVGQPEDVADMILLVAFHEARWATGQVFDATGGFKI